MSERLPAPVVAEVQRILDGAARRLLLAWRDEDAFAATAAGRDRDALDRRADDRALLVEGEDPPSPR